MKPALGIDLGGTKVEIVALDGAGDVTARHRVSTPRDDYRATIEAIANLVEKVERDLGQPGTLGVGHPGSVSPYTGLIRNANSTWLNDQRLDHDLKERLDRDIAFANDANCLALSEATDGGGAGAPVVFAVILGTGVGGGVVVHGRLVGGHNGNAGEWGHNPLPWPEASEFPGPACWCGLEGCIETWLSGTGLRADYKRASGEAITGEQIVERASQGETLAVDILKRYSARLGRATASIINVIDPDVIVLGGGVSRIDSLYETVPGFWSRYVFSDDIRTKLVPAVHGDSSGVRGAAWLGRQLAEAPAAS
ncbi:MAG: ROK family protein [Geminicoccaceae bacterium]